MRLKLASTRDNPHLYACDLSLAYSATIEERERYLPVTGETVHECVAEFTDHQTGRVEYRVYVSAAAAEAWLVRRVADALRAEADTLEASIMPDTRFRARVIVHLPRQLMSALEVVRAEVSEMLPCSIVDAVVDPDAIAPHVDILDATSADSVTDRVWASVMGAVAWITGEYPSIA